MQRVMDDATKKINEAKRRITTYEQTKSKAAELVDNNQKEVAKLKKKVNIRPAPNIAALFWYFSWSCHFSPQPHTCIP